jgi:hypothetical protein
MKDNLEHHNKETKYYNKLQEMQMRKSGLIDQIVDNNKPLFDKAKLNLERENHKLERDPRKVEYRREPTRARDMSLPTTKPREHVAHVEEPLQSFQYPKPTFQPTPMVLSEQQRECGIGFGDR